MRSENVLVATGLKKTFKLSRKQQRIERTDKTVKVAVDGLSFTARRGEIYGLLGPNGAGKTTTLRMLATLINPDEGDAVIDGESIVKNPEKVRGKIGFLTSELKLEDFFTPEYLYGYFSELHGVEKSVAEKRKNALFKKFGIDKFAEVKVGDLSTGMKQKVSLVISIVHDPDFIIFDEPTNGLDPNQIVEIRAGRHHRENGHGFPRRPEKRGKDDYHFHAYFFACGKTLRPRGDNRQRQNG